MGKIGIIGVGLIGKSWAEMFLRSGYEVSLYDAKPGVAAAVAQVLKTENSAAAERVSASESLSDLLRNTTYVQESVAEILSVKVGLFKQIDETLVALAAENPSGVDPNIVLASSTSTMKMSDINVEMIHYQSHTVVVHPVNPPASIPLTEVVPTSVTKAELTKKAYDLVKEIGQTPVLLKKEVDGFVVNRLQWALLAESVRLVQDGVITPEDLDLVISDGLARRWAFMGPFQTIDLNAPEGTVDYFTRFFSSIRSVIVTQDNNFELKDETVKEIDSAMRKINGPVNNIPAKSAWRNRRLDSLHAHLIQEREKDKDLQ